jgi:hypothetical protein
MTIEFGTGQSLKDFNISYKQYRVWSITFGSIKLEAHDASETKKFLPHKKGAT